VDSFTVIWYSLIMKDLKPKLIIIAGPTASGKTSLAVEMAHEFNGEIINADSMQVYRYMDIGTAKPTVIERRGIVHHLIDVADPDDDFNASRYRELTIPAIKEIIDRKKTCFVVGGTGLYIKTLLGGLMECPASDPDLRDELINECKEKGSPFMHERLSRLDPESAGRIHPNDRTRVIRALEIISLTDRPHSSIIMGHGFSERPFLALKICLNINRDRLYDRINDRSRHMIEAGLIDETRALLARGYSPELRSMNSLGYRHAAAFLNKEWSLEIMMPRLKQDTRRYAKRQLTWFRADHEMIWADPDNPGLIKSKIQAFLD
jgi:tRNA dimethylallyltransferase